MLSSFSELLLPCSFYTIPPKSNSFSARARCDVSILFEPVSHHSPTPSSTAPLWIYRAFRKLSACGHIFPCSSKVATGSGMALEGGLGLLSQPAFMPVICQYQSVQWSLFSDGHMGMEPRLLGVLQHGKPIACSGALGSEHVRMAHGWGWGWNLSWVNPNRLGQPTSEGSVKICHP